MSKTQSVMLPLGTKAPVFVLPDVTTGKQVPFVQEGHSCPTVIAFICNHCPYVKHINTGLTRLATDYIPRGIRFLAISSNDATKYPDDSPSNMQVTAKKEHYPFPYLYDETQEVAKAYQAACTPDFFIFDQSNSLVYRGQFDDSRPGNTIPVTGDSISHVLDCLINGSELDLLQKPSIGCNIKWK